MYDFSSGFGVINNAFANIAKQNELAYKQRTLAELGKDISSGNYASAAQKAIASGDATLGVSLLGLGQKASEKAAEAEWMKRYGGGGETAAAPAGGIPMAPLGQRGFTPRATFAGTEEEVQALEGSTGTPGQKVAARLVNNGLTPVAAAGVASNLNAESRFRTTARNPGDGRDGSDSVGMAQWNGPRAVALKQFAATQGKDWRDPNVQADFVAYELRTTEGRTGAALDNAQTPQQAGAAAIGYFRPQGYTAANPMGAKAAGARVSGANQFVLGGEVAPPAGAFTPEPVQVAQAPAQPGQPVADVPAQGAQPAQGFVIPGTTAQQTDLISADPQVRGLLKMYESAPEKFKAGVKARLDLRVEELKQARADGKLLSPEQEAQRIRMAQAGRTQINNVNEAQKLESAEDKARIDTNTKFVGKLADSGPQVAQRMADMDVLASVIRDAPDTPVADVQVFFDRVGAGLGLSKGELATRSDAMKAIIQRLAPAQREEGSGSTSDIEFKGMLASFPSLATTKEGRQMILTTIARQNELTRMRIEVANEWAAGDIKATEARKKIAQIDRASIYASEDEKKLIRKLAGTAKGGDLGKAAPAMEREVGGQVYVQRDGQWYLKGAN